MRRVYAVSALLLGAAFISGCQQEVEQAAEPVATPAQQPKVVDLVPSPPQVPVAAGGMASGKVLESMDAGGYTYVKVATVAGEIWAAGPVTAIKVGEEVSFSTLIPMQNFHSNAMNRDFPLLYFVEGFTTAGSGASDTTAAMPHAAATAAPAVGEKLAKVEGGYTIAEALAQKAQLAGKPIKVRGKVTKFTGGIMGKNWIHIVDGSGADDLIVTTTASSKVGDIIVAEGALSLDRDFGYGYRYEVLMEDGSVTVE